MILSITPSESKEQIDLDELIGDYKVVNVDGFRSYLKQVWKNPCFPVRLHVSKV